MEGLTSIERDCIERAMAADMLPQVESWSTVNSGSRNLEGLAAIGDQLAGAFADLPGELQMLEPAPVDAIDAAGKPYQIEHGRNLRLTVRADAPVQLLF